MGDLMKGRSNGTFFSKLVPNAASAPVKLQVTGLRPGKYRLTVNRTGYKVNDAYSAYIEMGSPKELSKAQLAKLQDLTRDVPETNRVVSVPRSGSVAVDLPMRSNDVALVKLDRI